MPLLCLGRYWMDLLMGSKREWFHKNLKSKKLKFFGRGENDSR